MKRYTSFDLIAHVANSSYLQMSLEDLKKLLREASVDNSVSLTGAQMSRLDSASRVIRDHLAVMEAERQVWLADERERRSMEKFGALERKLTELKEPHWTVQPNFWFTVTSAIAAVIGVVVLLTPSCVNPAPVVSPQAQVVSPKEPAPSQPQPVPPKESAPVSTPSLLKPAVADVQATPPKKEEPKPQGK